MITPAQAIIEKCVQCSGGVDRVEHCILTSCPLYNWRTGSYIETHVGRQPSFLSQNSTFNWEDIK